MAETIRSSDNVMVMSVTEDVMMAIGLRGSEIGVMKALKGPTTKQEFADAAAQIMRTGQVNKVLFIEAKYLFDGGGA